MNSLDSGESLHAQINIHDSLCNFGNSNIDVRKNNKTANIAFRNNVKSNPFANKDHDFKKKEVKNINEREKDSA